jgi:class 3 adenylate cyclase/predicted ATPase
MVCPKCGFDNPQSLAFCGRCGSPTTLISPFRQAEATDSHLSRAERRQLTVMFCDLVGSTALSGQLDPEELSDVTRAYQSVCAEIIERHAGRIAQFMPDGLLVYFGYPLAHEDDAQRAVRAALEIIATVTSERVRLGSALQLRIAIHTGLAVVGQLGGETNPNPMAISGETPNIAARLRSIAEPGQVVVSAATYRLIQGFFICRGLGTPVLKGVAVPTEAFEVIEPTGIHTRFEIAVASGLTSLVGREMEVELLLRHWEESTRGRGHVVMLSGEPGIGKSRLLRVLKERTGGEWISEFETRCSPYAQSSPLYPAIDFMQNALQFQRDDDAGQKLVLLEQRLKQWGFTLPDSVPLFAALLSLPPNDRYPALPMTPQRQKQKTLEAIVAFLLHAAELHPTRVIVEDLHWADPSTLELLELIIEQVPHARLFVALAFRPDLVPPWPAQPHMTNITLAPLSRGEIEVMVRSIAGGNLPAVVVNEIATKTEGVPLFVEELTRMVLETELVEERNGVYELTSSLPALAIPATLYDSLMARLDRLGTAKEVTQLAAVIGREFSYELLRAISPLEETRLTGALNRLIDAELLEEHSSPPRLGYRFKHALIRDAAYESLLRSQRRQYHRKIAEVLQQQFGDIVEARPELLASHFTDAGAIADAIPHWQRAAQQALQQSANKEAIRHLTKALELLETLTETPPRLRQQLLLLTMLGTALITTKGFSTRDVIEVYARARALSQQVGEAAQFFPILWGQWVNCSSRAEYAAALEFGQECLSLATNVADPVLILEAHHALGVHYCTTGEFEQGLEHLEQAINLYNPANHKSHAYTYGQDPAVLCRIHAGFAFWFLGYPDQTLNKNNEALALVQELSHPATSAMAAAFGAQLYQFCGDVQAAAKLAATAVDLSIRHELAFTRAMGTIIGGWALSQQGEKEAGIQRMRRGLELLRATDAVTTVGYFSSLLADAYGEVNKSEEGLKVLVGIDSGREKHWEAELYRLKGELMFKYSRVQSLGPKAQTAIDECFRQALAIARAQNAKSLELRAAMSLARLLRSQRHCDEARTMLAEIYGWFTEGFDTADLKEAKALLDDLSR